MKKFLTALFLNLCAIVLSLYLGYCLYQKAGYLVAYCIFFMAMPSFFITNILSDFDKLRLYRKIIRKRSQHRKHISRVT